MEQYATLVVGITGQSGGGKTLVASQLSKYGFDVIDADVVSRKVVERGRPALLQLVDAFGPEILQASGNLDRSALADIVFNDKAHQATLHSIIFPHIIEEIEKQIDVLRSMGSRAVFLDAPTLFESGANELCDKVISVIAPRALRTQRILQRDSITPEQVEARLSSQQEDEFYTSRSDFVIQNTGNANQLETQVLQMLAKFQLPVGHQE